MNGRLLLPMLRRWSPALLAVSLAACNPSDQNVFKNNGGDETKPVASALVGIANAGASGSNATAVTTAASVTYLITVKSASDAELCSGTVSLSIMSDLSFKVPTASIQCLSLSIDLAGLLAGTAAGTTGSGSATTGGNISDDGMVLSIATLEGATFSPPRPLLLGPIIQNESKFQNFTRAVSTTVTGTDATSGAAFNAPGTITLTANQVGTTYSNTLDGTNNSFTDILHWTMTATGFNGVSAKNGLLFKDMEFYWNINPIMIPKIHIEGDLSDFIQPAASTDGTASTGTSGDFTSEVVGTLQIDLTVQKFNFN